MSTQDPGPRRCTTSSPAGICSRPVPADAPIDLCERHLAVAAEWVASEFGVVDALPSPCLACGSRLGVRYPAAWLCAVCEWRFGDIPDSELAPPRVDVVYYLRFDDRIKIGTSGNPRQRLARIWHDELLGFERGGRSLEQHRHAQFALERQGTSEWFTSSPRLDAHISTVAASTFMAPETRTDPWSLYARWLSEALALRT